MERRKEIYARGAVQLCGHPRAFDAETRCPGAMGLYFFLLMQARWQESSGDVPRGQAHASWGAPVAYRKKQEAALIAAGLVEEIDGILHVIKYEAHNDAPDVIAENRRKAREKKRGQRHPGEPSSSSMSPRDGEGVSPGTDPGSPRVVPYSYSISSSSSSPEGVQGEGPPDWFRDVVATIEMTTGEQLDVGLAWLRYEGHRATKGIAVGPKDAQYFLSTVDVRERQQDRARARERADAREARGAAPQAKTLTVSPEESKRRAEALAREVMGGTKS